jgi:putative salt-induced outer membrane protein YdiY
MELKRVVLSLGLVILIGAVPGFSQEEEKEEEKEKQWKGDLGLSYVKNTGNSDNQTAGLDFKLEKNANPWGVNFRAYFNTAEESGEKSAEQYYLGARAKRSLSKRWDVFAGLSGARDEFAGFSLRALVEAGGTYHALLGPKHNLSFDGGFTYTDEDRVEPNPDMSFAGAVAGLLYEFKISETASLTQTVNYYPNFDDSADWRVNAETGLVSSISSLLALKVGYLYRYRNEPIGGAEATDTTTTASVVLKF